MRRLWAILTVLWALGVWTGMARAADDPWAGVTRPTTGPAVVIGSAAAGCLAGAEALARSGPGWQVLRPARHRYYGYPATLAFVRGLAAAATRDALGTVLVGDMAQPRGGPMPAGHGSHQNGLDVDIWFRLPPAPLSPAELDQPAEISMVRAGAIDRQVWGPPQARLLLLAARAPGVDRIFVNPAIKAAMCRSVSGPDRVWLARLRPWWGHDAHFHVRLACPAGDSACVPQKPVPEGDGCGAELSSWMGQSAVVVPDNKPNTRHVVLPQACRAVLRAPAAPTLLARRPG
jgi:penicillin-insensitive murein DD-endopeptidase